MITINPINTNNNYRPTFGIYFHTVKDNLGNIVYRGDTRFFRGDINWNKLVDFLEEKYKNTNDVKIIMHACSNGEEAYSLITVLLERLGQNAEKFFPILAKDIDTKHINLAKTGIYDISLIEKMEAKRYIGDNFYKYFDECSNGKCSKPKEFIKNKVIFEWGDILEDVKTLSLKNKILLARNFMPYLGKEEIYHYVNTLAQKADESTTIIIGGFDRDFGMDTLFNRFGFKRVGTHGVFEKKK